MPFVQAKCPECGGMLAVDDSKKAAVCQFCGEAFIVREAVNNYNTYNTTNNNYNTTNQTSHNYSDGTVVNVYEDTNKDFVIEAGVLKEYHGESSNIIIPNNVTEIGDKCFEGLNITSVIIPNSVSKIGFSAFSDCKKLKSVEFSNGLNQIGGRSFFNCQELISIVIPDSVSEIGGSCFWGCGNLKEIKLSNKLIVIEKSLFYECSSLKCIEIPFKVKEIENEAFLKCTNLEKVVFNGNIEIIGDSAFSGCSSLTHFTIPNNVKKIGDCAFAGTSIKNFVIHENIMELGEKIFKGCESFEKLTMFNCTECFYNFFARDYNSEDDFPIKSINFIGDVAMGNLKCIYRNKLCDNITINDKPIEQRISWILQQRCQYCGGLTISGEIMGVDISRCRDCLREVDYSTRSDYFDNLLYSEVLSNSPKVDGHQSLMWKFNKKCQYCGGDFNKSIWEIKCKKCRKRKNY